MDLYLNELGSKFMSRKLLKKHLKEHKSGEICCRFFLIKLFTKVEKRNEKRVKVVSNITVTTVWIFRLFPELTQGNI